MWSYVLWPFAVVLFELLVFGVTFYLVRTFARDHDADWEPVESPSRTLREPPAQTVVAPARAEREPAVREREPVGVA